MNFFIWLILFSSIILFSGCATTKYMTPTGGSKADAIIKLSYEYGLFEVPQVDFNDARQKATRRCAAWGYTGSESFGGSVQTCNEYSNSECVRWLVTTEFQCIGELK